MGLGDWIVNSVKSVKDKVSETYTTVKEALIGTASNVKDFAEATWDVTKGAAVATYNTAAAGVKFAADQINNVTSGVHNLLSSPFTMIALAIGGILALKVIK